MKSIRAPRNTELKRSYTTISKKVKKIIEVCSREFEKDLVVIAKRNPKLLFSYIKLRSKGNEVIRSLELSNGDITCESQEILNFLNDYFFQVFDADDSYFN